MVSLMRWMQQHSFVRKPMAQGKEIKHTMEELIMRLKQEELTLEQKLGMLYCARPFTDRDLEFTLELIKKRALGSVQILPTQPHYMKKIKEVADYPIIIVCDTETGYPTPRSSPSP